MENKLISTALESGDFHTALPLLENMTSDQLSELTLPDKCTPLHYACRHGRVDVAQQLITQCKYSIESKDGKGCTPLHTAAQYGQVSTLKYLLHRLFITEEYISSKLGSGSMLARALTSMFQCKLSESHRDQSGNTPLHTACVCGQLDIVQLLTREIGCDPNDANSESLSCLHLAAQHGHLPLVRYLIEEVGSDVTLEDEDGRSPTYLAAGGGHLDILKYLIGEKGADPQYTTSREWKATSSGRSLVHTASREGHLDVVRYLVEQHGCNPSHKDDRGFTPLYLACQQGHMDIVTYLITERNCDPNRTSYHCRTCLHASCAVNHLELVKYLVDIHHCDPLCPDKYNNIPLHFAALNGHLDIVKFYIEDLKCDPNCKGQFKRTSLHKASQSGHIDIVKYLIDLHHCDPLCSDKDKNIPLQLAALNGHLDIVKFFIEDQKCDPNYKNLFKRASLHEACQNGHINVVKYLADIHHCDPLCPDRYNNIPLHLAALYGHLDIVKFFIEDLKCDPNYKNQINKTTSLHDACRNGHIDVVNYLIEIHHCDPLCPDIDNETPLQLAVTFNGLDITRYFSILLAHNHLVDDNYNDSLLHYAALQGFLGTVHFFIEKIECDPDCKNQRKRTPLHHAVDQLHFDVVKYLIERQHCDPLSADEEGTSPLHLAILKAGRDETLIQFSAVGSIKAVKFLIEDKKCDLNYKDYSGKTPLHHASEGGHFDVVKYLVNHDPNKDSSKKVFMITHDHVNNTPLHYAAQNGHLEVIKFFTEEIICDPNCKGQFGRILLHYCSEGGHLDCVKYLVEKHHCDPLWLDEKGDTPLHMAVLNSRLNIIQYIAVTLNSEIYDYLNMNNNDFLLHYAAHNGYLTVVKLFIDDVKCDANCMGKIKRTSLHNASLNGHIDIVKYLVDHCDLLCPDEYSDIPLHLAALNGHLDIVKIFVEDMKCDPNCKGQFKRTSLHNASLNGYIDIVKYLVEIHHCDPLCPDIDSKTPLQLAITFNRFDITQYFSISLAHDHLVDDNYNDSLLHYAALKGSLGTVQFLIEEIKCNPNCKNKHKRTPLHHACEQLHYDVVKYLIQRQHCDLLNPDEEGTSPLHLPIFKAGRDESLLLFNAICSIKAVIEDKKCNLNIKDHSGRTPLHSSEGCHLDAKGQLEVIKKFTITHDNFNNAPIHYAAQIGHLEVVKFFTEVIKCDPNCKGQFGRIPLHFCSEGGHLDCVKYLVETHHCDLLWLDENEDTPLHMAVLNSRVEIIEYIAITLGCLVLVKYINMRESLLHYAALNGHLSVVQLFINYIKLNPNHAGQIGRTPLHRASEGGHLDIVKYLVDMHHCDPTCPDEDDGQTPLHRAAANGHLEVVRFFTVNQLQSYNSSPRSKSNLAPVRIAVHNSHLDIVKFFIENTTCDSNIKDQIGRTPLHHASEGGHLDTVKYLVDTHHCDPTCLDDDRQTPLHKAAANGHLEVVRFFTVILSCDPSPMSKSNLAPVHIAARNGHLEIVKFFIEDMTCDPNIKDQIGRTSLHHASEGGHLDVVQYFVNYHRLEVIKKLTITHDNFNNAPLHYAAQIGHLEVVKFFTEEIKCDPNCKGQFGRIPLHYCSEGGHLDCVKYLVETHHCDPFLLDKNEDTPLHMAVLNSRVEIIEYIAITLGCLVLVKDINMRKSLLHYAALNGHLSVVQLFTNYIKLNPNHGGQIGRTPLHRASEEGHLDIVKYLVDIHHCDPTCPDEDGQTPLHRAAANGHLEVVRFFTVILSCDPSPMSKSNLAPVHIAACNGHLEIVKFFIEDMSCDPNVKDQIGRAPLHHAGEGGHLEVMNYLINSHYCDEDEKSLLHYAAKYGHLKLVRLLIEECAVDPNIRNHSGWTPLICAIEHDRSQVIKYFIFLEKCHLLDSSSNTDVNALNFAVKKKNFEVLKLLCTTLRLDPYLESDRRILFEAVDNAAMILFDLFKSYVDPLHHAAITGDMNSVRHYVEIKKWRPMKFDRHGNNSLHNAAQYGQLEVVKYLTGLNDETQIHCDPMRTNGKGLTAEEIASQEEHLQVVSYLLRATTNKLVCQQDILSPSLNIFVIGNSGAGKSTLAKALSKESSFLRKLTTVKGVTPLTAGIVPTTIDSRVFGDVKIYDFAGHEEYYASNEILLQQTSHPLVLLTVNISLSWQEIEKQLHYWLSILSNTHICHVVVIGSHADKIKEKSDVYQNLEGLLSSQSSIKYHGFIQCDCRYSSSDHLNQLRQKLNSICQSIRLALAREENDDSNRLCASLMFHLKHNMPEQATITVSEICKQVKESESTCPNLNQLIDQDLLIQTCKNLSANGHMLFLPHSKILEKGFLVLDERIVLSRVHACLTVIKKELENNFGILDENQLQIILSKSLENMMEPDFAIKYLIFTQFCTEITSDQLISMSLEEKHVTHYFFPNLVLATRPPDLLPSGRQTYTKFNTWCLKCTNAHQFFTPRYLHTLFIQIVKCERESVNTECKIWKNGILLVHSNGTRSIIEVTDQTTRVYLAIQCVEGYKLQLVKQRSFLISLIKSLVHKICPRVKVEELLLLSQETYPPNNTSEIPISKVAHSVISGHGMVSYDDGTLQHEPVEDLLHFEAFQVIKDKSLRDCVRRDTNDIVPPTTLARIHSAVETCRELQERFEDESGQCRRRMTYSQVHKEITKYSIFTGGDLSVS